MRISEGGIGDLRTLVREKKNRRLRILYRRKIKICDWQRVDKFKGFAYNNLATTEYSDEGVVA